jgi:hypothetical protein
MLDIYIPSRQLGSQNDCLALVVPRSRILTYGDRAFMAAAPKLWNAVPKTPKSRETLTVFMRPLKTHLFKKFYLDLLFFRFLPVFYYIFTWVFLTFQTTFDMNL